MSDVRTQAKQPLRRYALLALTVLLTLVSPIAGAIMGIFALKQVADRQTTSSNKRLARVGMILLAAFTVLYVGIWVLLASTGYDPYP